MAKKFSEQKDELEEKTELAADEFRSTEFSSAEKKEIYEEFRKIGLILKVLEYKNKKIAKARESASKGKSLKKEEKFKYTFKDKEFKWFKNLNGQTLFSDGFSEEEKRGYRQISSEMAWAQIDGRFKVVFEEMVKYIEPSQRKLFFQMCKKDLYLSRDLVGMVQVMKHLQSHDIARAKAAIIYFGLEDRMNEFDRFFIYKISESTKDEIKNILQEAKDQGLSNFELQDAANSNLNETTAFFNKGKASLKTAFSGEKITAFDIAVEKETGKKFVSSSKDNNLNQKNSSINDVTLSKNNNKNINKGVSEMLDSAHQNLIKNIGDYIVKVDDFNDEINKNPDLSREEKSKLKKKFSENLYRSHIQEIDRVVEATTDQELKNSNVSNDVKVHRKKQTTRDLVEADYITIIEKINKIHEKLEELNNKLIHMPEGPERKELLKEIRGLRRERVALYYLKHGKHLTIAREDERLPMHTQLKLIDKQEYTLKIEINLEKIKELKAAGGNEDKIKELEEENKVLQEKCDALGVSEKDEAYARSHRGCTIEEYKDPEGDIFAETRTKKKALEGQIKIKKAELKELNKNKEANKEAIEKVKTEIQEKEAIIAELQAYLDVKGKEFRELSEKRKGLKEVNQYNQLMSLFENVKVEKNYNVIENTFTKIEELFDRNIQDVSILVENTLDKTTWSREGVEKVKIEWMIKKLDEFEAGIDTYSENPLVTNKIRALVGEYKKKLTERLERIDNPLVIEKKQKTIEDVKADHLRNIQEYKGYLKPMEDDGAEFEEVSVEKASNSIKKVASSIQGLCNLNFEFDENQIQMCEEALKNAEAYLVEHKDEIIEYDYLNQMLQNVKDDFENVKQNAKSSRKTVESSAISVGPESPTIEEESPTAEKESPTMGVAGEVSESKLVEEATSFTIVHVGPGVSKKVTEPNMTGAPTK